MKKILLFLALIIIAAIALVYIFIPNKIIVSKITYVNYKTAVVLRCLQDDLKWQQWFPEKTDATKKYIYGDQQYILGRKDYSSIVVSILNNNTKYISIINVIPFNVDSSAVQWQLQFTASNNPFTRISQYQTARKIKTGMTVISDSFKTFIQSTKNVYGFDIKRSTLTDTALVSTKIIIKQYPSTSLIYSMIDQLKQYIVEQHAIQHNYPMLNITQLKDSSYEVMVGVPTNILLKGNNIIQPKRMIMLKDKTLITEVVGDTSVIKNAFRATSNYMDDYELSSPVIPFQQLVTDRSKEKDSTKWITKIFTPII